MSQVVSPNWHVILIHYPIALISVGLLIEILSFLWRRSSVRTAGRWMLLIGALACIPALTTGLYAFADVSTPVGYDMGSQHWYDVKAASPFNAENGVPWVFMRRHILYMAIATGILCLVVIGWIGSNDRWHRKIYPLYLLLVLVAMGLLVCGAWTGGETIYRFGAGVHGIGKEALVPGAAGQIMPAGDGMTWEDRLSYFLPPLQLHILLAGIVVALAVVSLGLSIRAITSGSGQAMEPQPASVDPLTGQTSSIPGHAVAASQVDLESALRTTTESETHSVPAARWWLLGTFIALLTGVAGLWASEWFDLAKIRSHLWPLNLDHNRYFVHTVCGTLIIVFTLMLAIGAKWARRNKICLAIVSTLLVIVIAIQVTVGIFMLYDTTQGPLTGFAKPDITKK